MNATDYYGRMYEDLLRGGDQSELERFRREYHRGVEEVHSLLSKDYTLSERWGDPALERELEDGYRVEICAMYPLAHPTECTVYLWCNGDDVLSRTVPVESIPGVVLFLERNADLLWGLHTEFEDAPHGEEVGA